MYFGTLNAPIRHVTFGRSVVQPLATTTLRKAVGDFEVLPLDDNIVNGSDAKNFAEITVCGNLYQVQWTRHIAFTELSSVNSGFF